MQWVATLDRCHNGSPHRRVVLLDVCTSLRKEVGAGGGSECSSFGTVPRCGLLSFNAEGDSWPCCASLLRWVTWPLGHAYDCNSSCPCLCNLTEGCNSGGCDRWHKKLWTATCQVVFVCGSMSLDCSSVHGYLYLCCSTVGSPSG